MKLRDKISDAIPDSAREYVAEHPAVLYVLTVPLVVLGVSQLLDALRLHLAVEARVAQRASDAARAASEALGG